MIEVTQVFETNADLIFVRILPPYEKFRKLEC